MMLDRIMMLTISLPLLLLFHSTDSMLLGWVESPGYPTGYPPHASFNWSRCAPEGHSLSVKLIHMDIEDSWDCENDAIKVYSNGNLISVLCGKMGFEELQATVNPSLLSAPGGCLSLSFHSDYSNTERHTGFRGFYTIKDFDECEDDPNNQCTQFCHNFVGGYHCTCRHGYHLAKDKHTCTVSCSEDLSGLNQGDVSSPLWPRPYAESANCRYSLSVEAHLQLELHFSDDFDVEQSPDGQCIDALRIETPSGILGPFCGQTPPPSPFLTHSNDVKIHFTSDNFGTNKGFSLRFQTRDKVCPAVVTQHSTVTPQKAQYDRGQTVTVKCEVGYIALTHEIHTLSSQYEATCQSTGSWAPSYSCEPVNCGFPNIPTDGILQLVDSENQQTQYKDQIQFHCTSEYYTLEGDDKYTCTASGEWVSDGGETKMPKCIEVCGQPEKSISSAGRILGGQNANRGEIPWHLLIKNPRGGASLINDRWAVTAAHVVDGADETSLRLFGGLVDGRKSGGSGVSVLKSERIIIHPGYSRHISGDARDNFDNDIALIKFTSRVTFGPNLLPICLPGVNGAVSENEIGTVSGWGMTENLNKSPMLKYAHLGVYPVNTCRDTPTLPPNKAMIFTDNMFCAGAAGADSCKGDSGGPFVLPSLTVGSGPYYLAGIVSWGQQCRRQENKGYYTKVENYVDWIKETIETTN
ncbi:calcium-dependent serine proteinase [Salarias fasciatus]|uniref:Calcium-dependent serine proteinase-like n=1 Tax=Salarias fasciatus TaxID=181472 RepID=A0A672G3M1_SALFA|nr:calcium-dependent serine proteinase-like [Salarias fasciatus]